MRNVTGVTFEKQCSFTVFWHSVSFVSILCKFYGSSALNKLESIHL